MDAYTLSTRGTCKVIGREQHCSRICLDDLVISVIVITRLSSSKLQNLFKIEIVS